MRTFGLIGFPLSHSFSAGYFAKKFEAENIHDCEYKNFELPSIEHLTPTIVNNPYLCGFNVTIPYKEQVIPYLNYLDPEAQEIGAVNTVKVIRKQGKIELHGYNTDTFGFRETLKPLLASHHNKALILGTGGAAKAVEFVLKKLGLDVVYVSRNPQEGEVSYQELNEVAIKNFPLIINSTPLGMYPKVDICPEIPYQFLTSDNLLYDLIYNPEETLFLKKGKEKGALTQNGLGMLKLQAEKAWEIFNKP